MVLTERLFGAWSIGKPTFAAPRLMAMKRSATAHSKALVRQRDGRLLGGLFEFGLRLRRGYFKSKDDKEDLTRITEGQDAVQAGTPMAVSEDD